MKLNILAVSFFVITCHYPVNLLPSDANLTNMTYNNMIYTNVKQDFDEILDTCWDEHLVRRSFVCYAKHNIPYTERYLTEITPCYLEQLIFEFRSLLNNFRHNGPLEDTLLFANKTYDLKLKCYIEMDYIVKTFR